MLDLALGAALLDALPHSCQLVLVGAAPRAAPCTASLLSVVDLCVTEAPDSSCGPAAG